MKKIAFFLFLTTFLPPYLRSTESLEHLMELWRQPVEFTPQGIARFFKYTFNQNLYGQSFLPSSLDHLIDFLDYGILHNKRISYFNSTIQLFHQRCKECTHVNSYALQYFLDKFGQQLAFIFHERIDYEQEIKTRLRKALYAHENAEDFFTQAAQEIHKLYYGTPDEPSRLLLAQSCTRFIESLLDKVIWNPREQEHSWKSFLMLARTLEDLYQANIIPETQSFNHLVWSLIYRYCYFIDAWGSELLPQTYTTIKHSLEQTHDLWICLDEQEVFLPTKRERLVSALQEGYFKACAKEKGFLSDTHPYVKKA